MEDVMVCVVISEKVCYCLDSSFVVVLENMQISYLWKNTILIHKKWKNIKINGGVGVGGAKRRQSKFV